MPKKTDIKICRYDHCNHPSKEIDITTDQYSVMGRMYFHKDCLTAKRKGEWKDEQTKADIQLIKNLWIENISNTVPFTQLFKTLNALLARGIGSDYLVFVVRYCIEHGKNLNYPAGLNYFVDNGEIKDAFARSKVKKAKTENAFSVDGTAEDDSPKFSVKSKPIGFKGIIGKKG